jgi:hypothetical protein
VCSPTGAAVAGHTQVVADLGDRPSATALHHVHGTTFEPIERYSLSLAKAKVFASSTFSHSSSLWSRFSSWSEATLMLESAVTQ